MHKLSIKIKRAYEAPCSNDGYRVLVDRLWPRGIRKSELQIDDWWKDFAPSTELRKWFGHDPANWDRFKQLYTIELDERRDELISSVTQITSDPITLIYAAKDERHNHAIVLREFMETRLQEIRAQ